MGDQLAGQRAGVGEPRSSDDEARVRLPAIGDLPFGVVEMLDVVGRPTTALDVGCGSGRLTVVLARRGAAMVGIDTSDARLAEARARARGAGVDVEWVHADMDQPLPFADSGLDAVVSRLSLMLSRDPVRFLREAARVLRRPGGVVVSAVWAAVADNPWFGEPRLAVAEVLGAEAATFARAFGRLGAVTQLEDLHRRAGFGHVQWRLVSDQITARSAADHWAFLTRAIDHYTRLDASLTRAQTDRLTEALTRRLEPYRHDQELRMPRRIVLVTARH
jgi:ubiquinone/menaquinone biosynthesis C-methylase UbiE